MNGLRDPSRFASIFQAATKKGKFGLCLDRMSSRMIQISLFTRRLESGEISQVAGLIHGAFSWNSETDKAEDQLLGAFGAS
jgi:hypothetical protein